MLINNIRFQSLHKFKFILNVFLVQYQHVYLFMQIKL